MEPKEIKPIGKIMGHPLVGCEFCHTYHSPPGCKNEADMNARGRYWCDKHPYDGPEERKDPKVCPYS